MENRVKVLVGLGNPGQAYEMTRHNMGHLAVHAFGHSLSATFRPKSSLKGQCAKVILESGDLLYLVLPETYMNLSGESVRACIKKLGVELDDLLIVSDDVEIPFGSMRLRSGGGHGGHNGLRSIESLLGTRDYTRLRLGISRPAYTNLEEYVLQNFNKSQQRELDGIMKNTQVVLDYWLNDKQDLAKQFANQTKSLDQGEDHEEDA
jgi:peptidyl-tRNA hydrolase, PTH1 family